jgi:hypothetical protein
MFDDIDERDAKSDRHLDLPRSPFKIGFIGLGLMRTAVAAPFQILTLPISKSLRVEAV